MNTLRNVRHYSALVSQTTKKSFLRQAVDILRLKLGSGKIGVTEYFELELFDDALYDWNVKRRFIGHRVSSRIDRALNTDAWRAIAYDKVVTYTLLTHLGFPIPDAVATFSRFGRRVDDEPQLLTIEDLYRFLDTQRPYPVFMKPIHGYSGVAVYGVQNIDMSAGIVELINGERAALEALTKVLRFEPYGGMLVQSLLRPSAAVGETFGERLSTLRVIVLLTAAGPKMHLAFWKIARRRNMADNFSYGQLGNMVGWINAESGTLERVIQGFWPHNQEIVDNPDTGRRMRGFVIPQWREVKDLCLAVAVHFPGLRIQSWDVALCDGGPVLVELNTDADLEIPQLIGRTPFMDETVEALLAG